jgi:2-polyprenyl-3-methyl-5-hydroxy-6-metoxy-1,4-benzoquinol methylase
MELTDRQQREREYHRSFAARNSERRERPISMDVVTAPNRRWWNGYWTLYTWLRSIDLAGKRVLVPGCGFGEDAIRIANMGASVLAYDISPESVSVARDRANSLGCNNITFDVMASEKNELPNGTFDMVVFVDILHHVVLEDSLSNARRALRDGGRCLGIELYTHSWLQRLRESRLVNDRLYPWVRPLIYGDKVPYITEDERKLNEVDIQCLRKWFRIDNIRYFNLVGGRFFSAENTPRLCQVDALALKCMGNYQRYFGGRVVFDGVAV